MSEAQEVADQLHRAEPTGAALALSTATLHLKGTLPSDAHAFSYDRSRGCVSIGDFRADVQLIGTFDDLRTTLADALRTVIAAEGKARADHYAEQARLAEASKS